VKRVALALFTALAGLLLVGAAAAWVPRGWLPDVALLVAVAAGLRMGGTTGAITASAAGWTADALSGGPAGTHAFLDLLAWLVTRFAQGRVDLSRGMLLAPFTAALAAAHVLGEWALGSLALAQPDVLQVLVAQVVVNALAVVGVQRLLDAGFALLDDDEAGRPTLRLDAGSGSR
jgi:rod shape-determining protein MreD